VSHLEFRLGVGSPSVGVPFKQLPYWVSHEHRPELTCSSTKRKSTSMPLMSNTLARRAHPAHRADKSICWGWAGFRSKCSPPEGWLLRWEGPPRSASRASPIASVRADHNFAMSTHMAHARTGHAVSSHAHCGEPTGKIREGMKLLFVSCSKNYSHHSAFNCLIVPRLLSFYYYCNYLVLVPKQLLSAKGRNALSPALPSWRHIWNSVLGLGHHVFVCLSNNSSFGSQMNPD